MLKKYLLIILAAGLIASGATFAVAQSSPAQSSNDSSANSQPSPPEKGGWHHGQRGAEMRTQELTKKLNLSSDQQTKIQAIFESQRSQMKSTRQDSSLSPQDRRGKMMGIRQSTDTQVRALLDSTQQKQWDEMQTKRGQWGEHHHGGPDSDQAPPPEQ